MRRLALIAGAAAVALAIIVVVAIKGGVFGTPEATPKFLGGAQALTASQALAYRNGGQSPFRQRLGPTSYRTLSDGVSYRDYAIEGNFDDVVKKIEGELYAGAGWQTVATTSVVPPGGRVLAKDMDRQWIHDESAYTLYRQPLSEGTLRVRGWKRSGSFFSTLR